VEGITVASRIESEVWREQEGSASANVRQPGGVDAVLSAEIPQDDVPIRVSARLVNPSEDRELWRETYERNAGDLFAIVRRLVQAIVGASRISPVADRRALMISSALHAPL